MIYITQLVYVKEGKENVFQQFENIAIPAIQKYNGRLLLRVRPKPENYIQSNIQEPYEIHIVEFHTEQDFKNFSLDPERKKFLYLKEESVKSVLMIKGEKL